MGEQQSCWRQQAPRCRCPSAPCWTDTAKPPPRGIPLSPEGERCSRCSTPSHRVHRLHHQLHPTALLLPHQDDPMPGFQSRNSHPCRCQPGSLSSSQWMTCAMCRGLRPILLHWLSNQMVTHFRHHLCQCHTTTWSVQQRKDCLGRCHTHINRHHSMWLS